MQFLDCLDCMSAVAVFDPCKCAWRQCSVSPCMGRQMSFNGPYFEHSNTTTPIGNSGCIPTMYTVRILCTMPSPSTAWYGTIAPIPWIPSFAYRFDGYATFESSDSIQVPGLPSVPTKFNDGQYSVSCQNIRGILPLGRSPCLRFDWLLRMRGPSGVL